MSGYLVATAKIRPSSLYYVDISACVSVIVILSLNIAAFCGEILAQEFSSTGVQRILFTKLAPNPYDNF